MAPIGMEPATSPGSLRGFCLSAERDGGAVFVRPLGILGHETAAAAVEAGIARWLAGGPLAFAMVEVIVRWPDGGIGRASGTLADVAGWEQVVERLDALSRPRQPFAGLALDKPAIMGIINVTPDSFSDGGDFLDHANAIAQGAALLDAGADILDVGGESTRPGADPVSPEEEIRRVVPVVRHFAGTGAKVSIDTRHAAVMAAALEAGAAIINDVTALTGDPESLGVAVRSAAPVVLMHMKGEPRTMQQAPDYLDVSTDVYAYLAERVAVCLDAGIRPENLCVDPGIGFGKTVAHNLDVLRHTALFHGLGLPVLIGLSRKGFIGALSRKEPPKDRLAGSLAGALASLGQGAQIVRVHDVAETYQARALWLALEGQSAT
ncbi:dihydropteroate synthase [Skermanella aerolata KACC 11604]|nr:dihydropteroate synthase [Skermanella aerolata KACC 11604]